ncbi:MAG: RdgB/HAM1 family non-canonical purine NTP pyrophosphatase [Planctomycetes bacterium]|nr:RdgB/HAM1 family non-canonical purine NTP pyrophosphatase [Planctomycetota bacterium]
MTASRRLVLGTRNRHKVEELRSLLGLLDIELATLDAYPEAVDVVEDGDTFAANATLKATLQARCLKQWVLGEDSGIVVAALDGAPGVYSARYAGPAATDDANNQRLLRELEGLDRQQRAAHYVCHMTLADPEGQVRANCEATCHGQIRRESAGTDGFGYDPLFEVVEYHRTFGELGPLVKRVLSHRSRAARMLAAQIAKLIETGEWERGERPNIMGKSGR